MLRPHLGYLGIGRVGKGPLLAPIWYSYDPGVGIHINMGATPAKQNVCVQKVAPACSWWRRRTACTTRSWSKGP